MEQADASRREASVADHTPGPWRFGFARTYWHVGGPADVDATGGYICRIPNNATAEANARLIAAAPLLEVIANAAGLYMWESLSDAFHQNLTQQRKAALLAAYRAFAGYRDGRLTMEQAWAEVAPLAKATQPSAPVGEANSNS